MNWYLAIHMAQSIVRTSNTLSESPLIRDFTNSCHLFFIFFFFSKPALSILERVDAVIFVLNVSRVGGGVHGPQAIFSFWLHVSTLPSRNSLRKTENDAIFCQLIMRNDWSSAASRRASSRGQTAG